MLNCVSSRPDSLRSRNRASPFGIQRYSRKLGQIFENKNLLSDLNKISYTQERQLGIDSPCVELDNLIMKVGKGGAKNVQNLFNLH